MDEIKKILKDASNRMDQSVEAVKHELATLRTGRATPALLDGITVDYYGQRLPINQIATITVPEPRVIVIQPWDKNVISQIEKAIQESDLGLNPQSDGRVIKLYLPQLSEERREELVKLARKRAEEGRVAVRNIRRDAKEHIERLKKEAHVPEDEIHRALDKLQKLTDEHIEKINKLLEDKEKEIREE